jgi:hypothetical protein
MFEIIVDDEQARVIGQTRAPIPIRDRAGQLVGLAVPSKSCSTAARVAEAETRLDMDGPWWTTEQVLNHLRSLKSS